MINKNQLSTPIYNALLNYVNEGTIPFHVPGHKQGKGNVPLAQILGQHTMSIDLTCMEDLDNICNPKSVIKEAQDLAAELFKADNAFFLVNGTTSGIQAMILSVCKPGDKIIMPRNAHKSAIGALILSGAQPVYIDPEIDINLGIAMGISKAKLREALEYHPDAKAVFVLNTTYYGIASDLKELVEIAHSYDIPVLVDEAHGAHLSLHQDLPISAMEAGADLSASSTHKLLGSLTQSSMLLHQGNLVNPDYVKAVLNLTQTTSPSYILLSSLDFARREMALNGNKLIGEAIRLANWAREKLSTIKGIRIVDKDILNSDSRYAVDPTKLIINVRQLGFSGYEIERILRHEYKIQVELSDLYNIILLITIADTEESISKFLDAFMEIIKNYSSNKIIRCSLDLPQIPEQLISPKEAFYSETRQVSIEDAEGEISAEMIMAYPPGIPIICPGERITQEIVDYVRLLHKEEADLQGTQDPTVTKIKVLNNRLVLLNEQTTALAVDNVG